MNGRFGTRAQCIEGHADAGAETFDGDDDVHGGQLPPAKQGGGGGGGVGGPGGWCTCPSEASVPDSRTR